jgi:electron-transferring-flavoprotein dehydrogenase
MPAMLRARIPIAHKLRSLHSTSKRQRQPFDPSNIERASDDVDICIVGGGPAGLSAAIRLKQLEKEKGKEVRVVVLEKGSEVGEYIYLFVQGLRKNKS